MRLSKAIGALALLLGGFMLLISVRFGGNALGYGIAVGLVCIGGLLLAHRHD